MKTALVLEGDDDLRSLLRTALAAEGLQVVEASSARDADAAIDAGVIDVAIVDGILADGSGIDWIMRLRARGAMMPVIVVSAFLRDAKTFRRLTSELHVSLVVHKPFEAQELARKVLALVSPAATPVGGESSTAALKALALLRRDFAAALPARIAALDAAIAAVDADPSSVAHARGLAHRLRGTAGSYGFAAVGEAAGRIEDLLALVHDGHAPPERGGGDEVRAALAVAKSLAVEPADDAMPASIAYAQRSAAVLVVDDDVDLLALVRAVGRTMTTPILTARTADEAAQIARVHPLLGALVDVHLEGGDSYALAAELRRTERNASIPVAFTSVDNALETRIAALGAGATRFVEKPLDADAFVALVQHFEAVSQSATGKALVVDDDPEVLAEYTRVLGSAGLRVETAPSADAVFEQLEKSAPDLLILDVNMPRVSGIDLCRAIRMVERWEMTPILVATAHTDANTRLQAFRAGASDVLAKPILAEELLARVGVQLDRARLVRERSEKDSLSGLLLRRPFLEALQRALGLATREGHPVALAMLDIDRFKRINDEHGHSVGDAIIAGLGGLLKRRFRVEDLRARWGGEEFVLAFPGQTAEITGQIVGRVLHDFGALRFADESGREVSATFSAGIAAYPNDGTSIATLVKRADERLYASKHAGRNRVSVEMPAVAPPRRTER